MRLYRPREGRKEFVGILSSYENGTVTLEIGGEQVPFDEKEAAQVRLYPRF